VRSLRKRLAAARLRERLEAEHPHRLVGFQIEDGIMLWAECKCGAAWRAWPKTHPRPPQKMIYSVEPLALRHLETA
jgi:hypothetical protein